MALSKLQNGHKHLIFIRNSATQLSITNQDAPNRPSPENTPTSRSCPSPEMHGKKWIRAAEVDGFLLDLRTINKLIRKPPLKELGRNLL
jgi:hypothetical protein